MGNRFSDLGDRNNPSQENMDNNDNPNDSNQNNSGTRIRITTARRLNTTRSTDYSAQASPYTASTNSSLHSERVTRLLNSLREANQSQNVLVQLQRAQNRNSSRRRLSASSIENPLNETSNIPTVPDMAEFLPSLPFLNVNANSNNNSDRESGNDISDHPLFSNDANGLQPSLFTFPHQLPRDVPFPFFGHSFSNPNSQSSRPNNDSNTANAPTEGPGQNFQTRHQDLNRLLAAAIRAISLTASENQQNIHNSARSEGAATPAAFMESFLQNLTQNNTNVSEPVPRLSLITQASGNDDPSSASIVRVFRLERNENSESETNSESNNQATNEDESNTDQNAAVPVLMIVIRSLTDGNNNNSNPTQPNSASAVPNQHTNSSAPRFPLSSLQEQILREHESANAYRAHPSQPTPATNSAESQTDSETPFTDSQRRSWIIYVIGSTYPPDHPLFSSLYSDNPSYEDLLALTNILGPVVPPTTTQTNIDKHLPIYLFDASIPGIPDHKMIHIDRCQVCLEDFINNDSVRLLTCSHGFHKDCIDRWLTRGCNKCPVCRSKAVPNATVKPSSSDPSLDNPGNATTAN